MFWVKLIGLYTEIVPWTMVRNYLYLSFKPRDAETDFHQISAIDIF